MMSGQEREEKGCKCDLVGETFGAIPCTVVVILKGCVSLFHMSQRDFPDGEGSPVSREVLVRQPPLHFPSVEAAEDM